jgi:hypothetical protein
VILFPLSEEFSTAQETDGAGCSFEVFLFFSTFYAITRRFTKLTKLNSENFGKFALVHCV